MTLFPIGMGPAGIHLEWGGDEDKILSTKVIRAGTGNALPTPPLLQYIYDIQIYTSIYNIINNYL